MGNKELVLACFTLNLQKLLEEAHFYSSLVRVTLVFIDTKNKFGIKQQDSRIEMKASPRKHCQKGTMTYILTVKGTLL